MGCFPSQDIKILVFEIPNIHLFTSDGITECEGHFYGGASLYDELVLKEMFPPDSFKVGNRWQTIVQILGWYGLIAVVIAYGTVSLSFISPNSYAYQLLNLSGSVGLGLVAFVKKAYQNTVLNLVWGTIAVVALTRLIH